MTFIRIRLFAVVLPILPTLTLSLSIPRSMHESFPLLLSVYFSDSLSLCLFLFPSLPFSFLLFPYMYLHLSVDVFRIYTHPYIYIERERERERDYRKASLLGDCVLQ